MTRKQKEMAYRKAAESIFNGIGVNGKELDVFRDEFFEDCINKSNFYWIDMRQTILLSCAELVRLNFEIE